MEVFDYSFDNLAKLIEGFTEKLHIGRYSLYLMDCGAPIGFRLAEKHPERVETLIVQNGNAYKAGLREFWDPIRAYWQNPSSANAAPLAGFIAPAGVKWQYTHGVRDAEKISPDNWNVDLRHLTRDGNASIQLALFYDYQNNVPHYPAWQAYFRKHQPPTLIVWGEERSYLPGRRCLSLPARSEEPTLPPARHWPLRTGRGRPRHCRTDPRVPAIRAASSLKAACPAGVDHTLLHTPAWPKSQPRKTKMSR